MMLVEASEEFEPQLIENAAGFVDGCLKAGWQYDRPCIVMDMTGSLETRESTLQAVDALRTNFALGRISETVIVGPDENGTVRWVATRPSKDGFCGMSGIRLGR